MTSYPDLDKFDGRTIILTLVVIVVIAIWLATRTVKGGKG